MKQTIIFSSEDETLFKVSQYGAKQQITHSLRVATPIYVKKTGTALEYGYC